MSAAELSRQLKVPTNRITGILNGQRAITGDTALRLAHFFGTSAQFWLNLQALYELRLAEQKAGKAIKPLPRLKRAKSETALHAEHRTQVDARPRDHVPASGTLVAPPAHAIPRVRRATVVRCLLGAVDRANGPT